MLDGRAEAHLIALSCSDPPEGRERWSLKLLADRLVELGYVESLPRDRQAHAQKNELKPHLKRQWVIPPTKSAGFVWRMEEVLDLYREPSDPLRPVQRTSAPARSSPRERTKTLIGRSALAL